MQTPCSRIVAHLHGVFGQGLVKENCRKMVGKSRTYSVLLESINQEWGDRSEYYHIKSWDEIGASHIGEQLEKGCSASTDTTFGSLRTRK